MASVCLIASGLGNAAPIEARCTAPDTSFRAFLTAFGSTRSFQESRIVYPLVVRIGRPPSDAGTVEIWGQGAVRDLKSPAFRLTAERRRTGIEQRVTVATENYAEVFHFRPEADSYEIRYHFIKADGCWYLESYGDTSL